MKASQETEGLFSYIPSVKTSYSNRCNRHNVLVHRWLERRVRHYVNHMLGGISNYNGYCFATSLPISVILENMGLNNQLVWGQVGRVSHCWILLTDLNIIIDPTASQFYRRHNRTIYVGKKPRNYNVRKTNNPSDVDFFSTLKFNIEQQYEVAASQEKLAMSLRAEQVVLNSNTYKDSERTRYYLNLLEPLRGLTH